MGDVEEAYIELVAGITRFQPTVIVVADDDVEAYAQARLQSNRIDMDRVRFITAPKFMSIFSGVASSMLLRLRT